MNRHQKKKWTLLLRQKYDANCGYKKTDPEYPKISIITASFNQAEFLERTILSVKNQSYKNVEHIIVDGGSSDNSIDIIKKYSSHLSYWVSEPDNGQAHAINKGILKAKGELVAFQNSDDVYLPNALETVARAAKKSKNISLFYGDILHIDQEDNVLDEQLLGNAKFWVQVYLGSQVHNQAAFWRYDVVNKVGLLNEIYQYSMDYEYFTRILSYGYKTMYIPRFLGALRHHDNSKTKKLQKVAMIEHGLIVSQYRGRHKILFLVPFSVGNLMARAVKVFKHILDGRFDYLLRHYYKQT